MPETRYVNEYDSQGKLVNRIPYKVSDEQLADEAEAEALAKADTLIDSIDTLAKAKVFLKRLCARLITKGVLP